MSSMYYQNGHLSNGNLALISFISLVTLVGLPVPYILYQLFKFKKDSKDLKKSFSKLLIVLLFLFIGIDSVMWTLNIVFYYGEGVIENADDGFNAYLVTAILGFAFGIAFYLLLLIFGYYVAMSINDEKLMFIGDSILLSKINAIILDKEKNSIYLVIKNNNKTYKKSRIKLNSNSGKFLNENYQTLGIDFQETDIVKFMESKKSEAQIEQQKDFENFKNKTIKVDESKKFEEIIKEAKPKKEKVVKTEDEKE